MEEFRKTLTLSYIITVGVHCDSNGLILPDRTCLRANVLRSFNLGRLLRVARQFNRGAFLFSAPRRDAILPQFFKQYFNQLKTYARGHNLANPSLNRYFDPQFQGSAIVGNEFHLFDNILQGSLCLADVLDKGVDLK